MKTCTKCGESKDESEFAWNNMSKGIRMSQCKACRLEYYHSNFIPSKKEPSVDIEYFKIIDTCEKAYWLGFLYADGFMLYKNNKYTFCLQVAIQDEIIIDRLREALQCKNVKQIDTLRNRALLKISIQDFCLHLVDKGVVPRKTNITKFPFEHLNNQEDLIYSFILGYFDGDGNKTNHGGSICSGNKEFLEEIQNALKTNYVIALRQNHWGSAYTLNISTKSLALMYDYYPNSLDRKKIKIDHLIKINGRFEKIKQKKVYTSTANISKLDSPYIAELYYNKISVQNIAKQFGVTPMTIYRHLHKMGIRS